MSDLDKTFAGSIPEIYDSLLVPLIFEDFARDLAGRVAASAPARVLEVAAGTGVVTRALAPALPADARYMVTDLNGPMLERARQRQGEDSRLAWQPADALALPFGDGEYDTVCCQFGVMFFPDRVAGFREARRVLAPGGTFVFNVWDRIEANVFADMTTAAAAEVFPDDPPRFLARTPHGYHDTGQIEREVRDAGFTSVSIAARDGVSAAGAARDPAVAYCQGTPLRNEIEARGAAELGRVTDLAASRIADRFGPGPVSAPIRGFVVTAS